MAKNTNPGKYPVPDHVIDWFRKRKKRRPQWWPTPELAKDLCSRLAEGETINAIAAENEFPSRAILFDWIARGNKAIAENLGEEDGIHPDIVKLTRLWARARMARLEASLDQMEEIERKLIEIPQRIQSEDVDVKGRHYAVLNPEALDVQAARTALESKRWRLSRELPERFGDKSKVEHSGSVKVERPADHMPEWMKAQLEAEAASQPDQPPAPQQGDTKAKTVH